MMEAHARGFDIAAHLDTLDLSDYEMIGYYSNPGYTANAVCHRLRDDLVSSEEE